MSDSPNFACIIISFKYFICDWLYNVPHCLDNVLDICDIYCIIKSELLFIAIVL